MGVVSLLDAIMGTSVDLKGLETGLEKAEKLVEEGVKKLEKQFSFLSIGIATAITGVILLSMEKAIKKTAEWGLEMEHLSNRMGVTTREAAVLVGVMERFGVNAGLGARAMQMLSTQVTQTQNSLDPFATRLGKTLGTLRDTNGQALNMVQVLELVRQKVSSAATDSEKLQIATSLLGARIGGQLVPMLKLSNEEWAKQKATVEASLGPVEAAAEQALAYKQATEGLEQAIRGIQVAIGTALLPTLIELINTTTNWITKNKEAFKDLGAAISDIVHPVKFLQGLFVETVGMLGEIDEYLGLMEKGTTNAWLASRKLSESTSHTLTEQEKLAEASEKVEQEIQMTEQNEKRIVALVRERVSLEEKSRSLGLGGNVQSALNEALTRLEEQRKKLESDLNQNVTPAQRLRIEEEITKNRVEAVELVSKATAGMYKQEELQIKAMGDYSLSAEIALLQRKLSDERVVGDERLKIEAELFQKRKQLTEESIKYARQLGFAGADDEISYRKQRAAELLGKGDVLGAAGEIVKARDLALKQADQVMEFTKKIRVVSLQSEIEYQKEKLELAKGNAEEEMKILGQIADLDKQLYDKRFSFALTYTQNTIDAYRAMQKATGQDTSAASRPQESLTFAQAANEAERARFQNARTLSQVAGHGGTEEQRSLGIKQAQDLQKQEEDMLQTGREITSGMREQFEAARNLLRAAAGGESVRAPGGPSPTIGSLLSPAEGLATATLARGSDIPRLDTSFTDLAIRVRDTLLSATSYVQGFSTALQTAGQKLASQFGVAYSPGLGPGGGTSTLPTQGSGVPVTSSQNIASPTVAPGGIPTTPTPQIGIGGLTTSDSLARKIDDLISFLQGFPDKISGSLQDQQAANAQSLLDALQQVQSQRVRVDVGIDPGTGDALVTRFVQELSQ
jgi:hypothetical protein